MKLSRLQKIINETVREQLANIPNQQQPSGQVDLDVGTVTGIEDTDTDTVNNQDNQGIEVPRYDERIAEIENYFYYIREHLQADNFDMAKSFIDRLKAKVTEMEKKAYAVKQSEQV